MARAHLAIPSRFRVLALLALTSLVACPEPALGPRSEGRGLEILAGDIYPGTELAVDASDVYWRDGSARGNPAQIRKVSKRGGPSVVLAEAVDSFTQYVHGHEPKMALVDDGVLYATGDCKSRAPCPVSLMLAPKTPGAPKVIDQGDRLRWIAGRGGAWIATPTGYRKAGSTTTVSVPALPEPSGRSGLAEPAPPEGELAERWHYKASVVDTTAIRLLYMADVGMQGSDLVSVGVPLDGQAPTVYHHRLRERVSGCVFDGADAYCLLPDEIIKVGPTVTVVAEKSDSIESLRITCDESSVYFTGWNDETSSFDGDSRGHWAVYRVRKSGGRVERVAKIPERIGGRLVSMGYSVQGIAVDQDTIYVLGERQLVRLSK
jgi:hypothetical protein